MSALIFIYTLFFIIYIFFLIKSIQKKILYRTIRIGIIIAIVVVVMFTSRSKSRLVSSNRFRPRLMPGSWEKRVRETEKKRLSEYKWGKREREREGTKNRSSLSFSLFSQPIDGRSFLSYFSSSLPFFTDFGLGVMGHDKLEGVQVFLACAMNVCKNSNPRSTREKDRNISFSSHFYYRYFYFILLKFMLIFYHISKFVSHV